MGCSDTDARSLTYRDRVNDALRSGGRCGIIVYRFRRDYSRPKFAREYCVRDSMISPPSMM